MKCVCICKDTKAILSAEIADIVGYGSLTFQDAALGVYLMNEVLLIAREVCHSTVFYDGFAPTLSTACWASLAREQSCGFGSHL